jgi:hypothetical protein
MKHLRSIALAVIAVSMLALAGLAGPTPPAGAAPSDIGLPISTYSPRYSSNGCLYRIVYLNYGSLPVADVRLYGSGCAGGVALSVAGANGTTITWKAATGSPAPYGVDRCGAYSLLQAVATQSGYAVGASIIAAGAWHTFFYDGTATPPPVVSC